MASLYEYFNPTGDSGYYLWGVGWYTQTFTIGNVGSNVDQMAYSVKLKLTKTGSPTATMTAGIRAVDGDGKPTGSDLCSGTLDTSDITSLDWYEITFSSSALLRASTEYAIVARCPDAPSTDAPNWRGLVAGGYAGGSRFNSSTSGASWSVLSGDFLFEVWGDPEGSGGDGAIFPTNPLNRASGIKRTFWAGIGGQSVYQAELALGGISTTYVSPIGERQPPSAVKPSLPTGYTKADYYAWLNSFASFLPIIRLFGHMPSYEEWVAFKQAGRI